MKNQGKTGDPPSGIEDTLSGTPVDPADFTPEYGDLSTLNQGGILLSTVGKKQLQNIASDYLCLLETSAAIYERNGDYALGLFSSGWCRMLDAASRRLCNTQDNRKALKSGKWLCHESCWKDASKRSMDLGKPVDVKCRGGLRLYAVPVRANGEIVGSINFGYGNPPTDENVLARLSRRYGIPITDLRRQSAAYQSRPPGIIAYAKARILRAADTLGSLIEQKRAEEETLTVRGLLDQVIEMSPVAMWLADNKGNVIRTNHALRRQLNLKDEEIIGKYNVLKDKNLRIQGVMPQVKAVFQRHEVAHFGIPWKAGNTDLGGGKDLFIDVSLFPILDGKGRLTHVACQWWDISRIKRTEERLRTTLNSIGDAVITTDLRGRVSGLNPVAEALTGWTTAAARDRPLQEVFRIVNAITGEKVTDPVQAVLEKGGVVGLANHTKLLSRKGEEFHIADSAAPIRDDFGGISGTVLIFRDVSENYRIQRDLAASEQRYRELFEKSIQGFVLFNVNGEFIDFNQAYCDMLGYSRAELLQKGNIYTITPTKWHQWQRSEIWNEDFFKRGSSGVYEKEYIRKDGSIFPVEIRAFVVYDQEGNISHLWGITEDISDRKSFEKAIKESRLKFQTIIQELLEGFFSATPEGKLLEYNREFTRIMKLDPATDHSGINLRDFWQDPGERTAYLDQLTRNGFIRNYEIRARKSDGEKCTLRANGRLIRDEKGNPLRLEITFLDITAEARARKALMESEHRFHELFDNMHGCVAVYRATGQGNDFDILDFNKSAQKVEKVKKSEVIGKRLTKVFPGAKAFGILDVFKRVWRTGIPEHFPMAQYKDNRISGWRDNYIYKLPTGEIVAIYEDVTELKQAEEELRENRERLIGAQRIAGMGDFTWDVETGAVNWSEALFDLLKYRKSEQFDYGRVNREIHHPEDLERVTKWLNDCVASGENELTPNEYRLKRKDGKIIHVRTTGIILRNSEGPKIFATVQDITERKNAQEKIIQSKNELKEYFDNDISANFIALSSGEITDCNQTFLDLFAFPDRSTALKTNFSELHEKADDLNTMIKGVKKQGNIKDHEAAFISLTGKKIHTIMNALGSFSDSGELILIRGYIVDITSRISAEKELQKHRDQLEKIVEEKTLELKERVSMLERFREATITREFRIHELREEMERLKNEK